MPDADRVIAQAEALLRRMSPEGRRAAQRARMRRWRLLARRFRYAAATILGIVLATGVAGLFFPVSLYLFLGAFLAMILAAFLIFSWPEDTAASPAALSDTDVKRLPQRTEQWLEHQRPALPATAARLLDDISLRLETLAPSLTAIDPRGPAALAARKLMAQELPELVEGYLRVPEPLRREMGGGQSPDTHLLEGLRIVDGELARLGADLARADLDRLATQGRYLELKYRGE